MLPELTAQEKERYDRHLRIPRSRGRVNAN